ncbi:hypothetical protein, partial [Elizabethkingia meningoseptica]|uniref:hypothetical protein n=1 Tax=Elizabethkingia meningoseptica TaxID=238 RepID=UPI0023B030FE
SRYAPLHSSLELPKSHILKEAYILNDCVTSSEILKRILYREVYFILELKNPGTYSGIFYYH